MRPAPAKSLDRPRRAAALVAAIVLAACDGPLGSSPSGTASEGGGGASQGGGGAGGEGNAATGAGGQGGAGGAFTWAPVETAWCKDGWLGLDEATCFHAPEGLAPGAPVVFFLHGMMPPDASTAGQQAIAADAADALGFVAIFPRGRQGLCAWDASVEDWWCWPTKRETVDAAAAGILSEWVGSEALLAQILGAPPARRYVVGFSNGGYFASYIGLEGLLPIDGAGVVAAGRTFIDESLLQPDHPPFYVAVGALDTASVQSSAQNLDAVLAQHGWPHDFVQHADRGHEIRADDFEGAWAAWTAP